MSKIIIDIQDDTSPFVAVGCVRSVIANGKISVGEKCKKCYCWAMCFDTSDGKIVVTTRPYRKNDCFIVYKQKK